MNTPEPRWLVALAALSMTAAIACTPRGDLPPTERDSPPGSEAADGSAPADARPAPDSQSNADVADPNGQREETWMACYINGSKIGYTHLRMEPAVEEGRACLRFRYDDELKIRRFDTETMIRTRLTSLETGDGQLLSFRSEMQAGPGTMATDGRREGDQLMLRTSNQGKIEEHGLPWQPQYGGFFADQLSLRRQPMRPGESRRLHALLPVLNLVGEVRLEAVAWEAIELPSGSRQLLRINVTTDAGAAQIKSVLWTDQEGKPHKVKNLQLGMEALVTTREDAQKPGSGGSFDLGFDTIVRVDRPLRDPHRTRQVVYRATLQDADAKSLFAEGLSQTVQALDDGAVELTVRAIRPDQPASVAGRQIEPPTDADRTASTMLQSDDPVVLQLAQAVAVDESDAWKLARVLESEVKQKIRLKNYTTAMATAAEVARSLEGDCTEHAMLLAAMCRARGIPARVAIGLVYYPSAGGFAYHMWTEVWIADRWIPLDATLGLGGIGAAHLKFAHSSMQGTAAYAELLPVIQALGRLQLEILSTE